MLRATSSFLIFPLFVATGVACSLTVPDEKQDGVIRCDNSSECPKPDDERLEAVCDWGEGQDDETPKVCWDDWRPLSCGSGTRDSDLKEKLDEADKSASNYVGCSDETAGKPSCQPDGEGNCEHGSPTDNVCPGPDGTVAVAAKKGLAGKDFSDQFCRSFFCEGGDWVCAPVGSSGRCQPCDPDKEFGEGGCGKLYVAGELSSAYVGGLDNADCEDANARLGTVPGM